MGWLEKFFTPPPMPPVHIPLPARVLPGIKLAIAEAFKLAYYRGVWDGLIAGALAATVVFLAATRRRGS